MAITDSAAYARGTAWTITSDAYLLDSVRIVFYTTHRLGLPTREVALALTYVDGNGYSGSDTTQVKTATIYLSGNTNCVGASGQPLQEATYNAVIGDLRTYLGTVL